MDTNRLKRFATEARTILMQGVSHRLQALGFDLQTGQPEEIPQQMEGGAVFMNDVVSLDFYQKWMSLYRNIQARSIREVAEEAAYTWFNRFMAIQIMEKQGFVAPVLEYESEDIRVPAIVSDAVQGRLPEMREAERRQLMDLLEDPSKTEEQFALLIVAFCHANAIINKCFGAISDYTELLLPQNILSETGFLTMLNHTEFITEQQYASAELIGWLYQFYISDRKDEAFAKKGKYDPDEIAPATQIFTPNWIVKYMVENTVGRIWLDNNPYSDLNEKMPYLVEVQEGIPTLKIEEPQQLKAADLASGSGHILNECFDLFYLIYQEEGYNRRAAIENILQHNILGIDLDTRAKQLAQFALLMKACQKDNSFLDGRVMPRVYSMPRPIHEVLPNFESVLPDFLMGSNQTMVKELSEALQLMNHVDTLGSIMKFDLSESTRNTVMIRVQEYEEQMANGDIVTEVSRQLLPYMRIILALTDHYAALCMNPPYMGSGRFDNVLSKYVKDNYEQSKADLFSVFMDVAINRLAPNGKYGMINMHSWMFLSSFERLRQTLLNNYHIDSLLHLGPRTFDELSGEVVQNAAFVITKNSLSRIRELANSSASQFDNSTIRENKINPQGADSQSVGSELAVRNVQTDSGTYFRLVDGKNCGDKERMFLDAQANHTAKVYYTNVEQGNFEKIPGSPIGYWISNKFISLLALNNTIETTFESGSGLSTADNNRFLRFIWEPSHKNIASEKSDACKWFLFQKGGEFRKWYGNLEYVVNWGNDGEEIKYWVTHNPNDPKTTSWSRRIFNTQLYLREGLTWSVICSNNISFRLSQGNSMISNAAGGIFGFENDKDALYSLAAGLNSKVWNNVFKILNPTINYSSGIIQKAPLPPTINQVIPLAKQNVQISKLDWDSHETSWDFEANPLVSLCNQYAQDGCGATSYRLENFVKDFEEEWEEKFNQLHQNEEELNRQFIEIYGLQDELTPDVPKDEITILQQGEISIEDNELVWNRDVLMKQFLSYAVGCMMGRYSIDKPGLILANQGDGIAQYNELVPNSRFEADDDGIVPLMSAQSDFADNATVRFKQWLATAFGSEMLVDNLNFFEKCLGKSIDDYFVKDFWKDHKRMYQNRPIYWLFASKKGAFQCLAYMHRMDAYTAERIRTKYLLPHIEWLMQKQSEMEANAANLNARERKELDSIVKQIQECREYHDRLHVIADQQIAFDLDDGVVVNYAKFGDVLAKIK